MSNFQLVSAMNVAFNNPQGDSTAIDIKDIRKQCQSIGHEFAELAIGLSAEPDHVAAMVNAMNKAFTDMPYLPVIDTVRDALCDIHVFGYGAHHKMGINADSDMRAVIDGVMTRFVKDEDDLTATLKKHQAKGVIHVTVSGEFPTVVVKSAEDQPDAPKGKFLKSASHKDTVFPKYPIGFVD